MLNISWRFPLLVFVLAGICGEVPFARAQPPADPMDEDSPLLIEPESPEEAFEAAVLMERLGRPGLAKEYLTQFLDADPDDEMLLKMRDRYGPARLLRMANNRDLHPESKTVLDKVNAAFRQRATDPERINRLIEDLSAGPRERAVAINSLRSAGPTVVPQLLKQAATVQGDERSTILSGIIRMGQQVVPPLVGALESPDEEIREAAIRALGYVGSRQEVPYLWRPAFGPDESTSISEAARNALTRLLKPKNQRTFQVTPSGAPAELKRTALEHYRNEYDWGLKDGEETVTIWTWDRENETIAPVEMEPQAASLYRGSQLARDALALSPEKQEMQALFLGFALANAAERTGWNAPLPTGPGTAFQLALQSGPEVVSRTLSQAMQNGNTQAAVAALQVLEQIASRTQLYSQDAESSPILAALNDPDPRVQFAAAVTVLQLDPHREFPGSGRVVEILSRALGDSGGSAVLIIDPNTQRANDKAAFFQQLGYRGQPVIQSTGQRGFNAAVERNDVELVAVQANVTRWDLSQTLANFRSDARTANLPILIYGPEWAEAGVQGVLRRTPLTGFALESLTLDHFREQMAPFVSGLQSEPLSTEERAAQAAAGAYWLAHIASGRRTDIFDMTPAEDALAEAIENPDLAGNALQALAAIPSKSAQQRLESVAVQDVYGTSLRELAAIQLAFHIQRHGLLLTSEQTREVQAAASAADDPQLASALASVLGSLKPNRSAVGTSLQEFPIPSPLAP